MPRVRLPKPGEAIQPSKELTDYSLCIFGTKGSGKTSLAYSFPKTFVLRFERFRQNVSINQYPGKGDPQLTWPDTISLLQQFCESEHYHYLVIDQGDSAWELCRRHVCLDSFGVERPQDLGDESYNAHLAAKQEWSDFFVTIKSYGKQFILLSHDKLRKKKDPTNTHAGDEILQASLEPQPQDIVKEMADMVWFYQRLGERRLLTIRSENAAEIVTQIPGVCRTPSGDLLRQVLMPRIEDGDFEPLFDQVQAAWDNKLDEYDPDLDYDELIHALKTKKEEAPQRRTKRRTKKTRPRLKK